MCVCVRGEGRARGARVWQPRRTLLEGRRTEECKPLALQMHPLGGGGAGGSLLALPPAAPPLHRPTPPPPPPLAPHPPDNTTRPYYKPTKVCSRVEDKAKGTERWTVNYEYRDDCRKPAKTRKAAINARVKVCPGADPTLAPMKVQRFERKAKPANCEWVGAAEGGGGR